MEIFSRASNLIVFESLRMDILQVRSKKKCALAALSTPLHQHSITFKASPARLVSL
jgi:hypothetical protein